MITKVRIRNFRSLRNVTIELERLTVLVGPNASGKSSILQGLDLLCKSFCSEQNDPQRAMNLEAEAVGAKSWGASDQVEFACESHGTTYRHRTGSQVGHMGPRGKNAWDGKGRGTASSLDSEEWSEWVSKSASDSPLPLSVFLQLEVSKLTSTQPEPNMNPRLSVAMAPNGVGLHTALANMALNDPDSWNQLQADLRSIIPSIRRLRHTKITSPGAAALLFDTIGAESLPASQISEGTLIVLGLLTALYAPERPNLVLLDDLDRGLHPKAQKDLITLLRGLLASNPELQLVATTHSPYMLDCVEAKEVRMTFLQQDGTTACAALGSHAQYEKWKDEMTPGEMWSLFGEKWLVEQEARP